MDADLVGLATARGLGTRDSPDLLVNQECSRVAAGALCNCISAREHSEAHSGAHSEGCYHGVHCRVDEKFSHAGSGSTITRSDSNTPHTHLCCSFEVVSGASRCASKGQLLGSAPSKQDTEALEECMSRLQRRLARKVLRESQRAFGPRYDRDPDEQV